ncbi:MAG TPA: SLBB domain-containing protein, partial [Saprospiraceae bacterium]|nr:SLBB domain-containing protein [Saprospiraceae bacterium]
TDRSTVSVRGAVRDSLNAYPYPADSSLSVQRAVLLAGGLRPDASGLGLILRTNPANPKEKTYVEVDLAAAFDAPLSAANVLLQPADRLEVLSRPAFADEATIQVQGSVRRPGRFAYGRGMSLREALLLAGGLRLEAARNRVDIYRIQIRENEPTRTIVATLTVDSTFSVTGTTPGGYAVQPFDEIVVRAVPEFEFQRYVEVLGEVRYPGRYALISDNETLADVVKRAGGLSAEAFAEGATLYREQGGKGYVVTNLSDALRSRLSPHNHILKEKDRISIPKREDLVSIRTSNTNAYAALRSALLSPGQINVAHTPGKRAGWYVREYAAGFDKNARRSRVMVEQSNGKISRTKNWGLFRIYPKVHKGSVVTVGSKPVKEKKGKSAERKGIDWDKTLPQILATLSTLATVALAAT